MLPIVRVFPAQNLRGYFKPAAVIGVGGGGQLI